jgi:hypothetical protein
MALEYGNEGKTTTLVESQTSRAPSIMWLGFAVASMAASAALVVSGRKQLGNFVGQWAPTILIMGVYNKIAKEFGAPQRARAYGSA